MCSSWPSPGWERHWLHRAFGSGSQFRSGHSWQPCAVMESFIILLEKEVFDRCRWHTRHDGLRIAIVTRTECTQHRGREQASLDRLTPTEFETIMPVPATQAVQPTVSPTRRAADPRRHPYRPRWPPQHMRTCCTPDPRPRPCGTTTEPGPNMNLPRHQTGQVSIFSTYVELRGVSLNP